MKILDAKQIKNWDKYTIKTKSISSYTLMLQAGQTCCREITQNFPKSNFHVIVNKGNNGGDGLVIFQELIKKNYNTRLTIIDINKNETNDFRKHFKLIKHLNYTRIKNETELIINKNELIIDCIFGTGLNRPIVNTLSSIIKKINTSKSTILSIDMPSGLFTNNNINNNGSIIKASYTYTFETIKLSLLLPSYHIYYGKVIIIPIGLSEKYLTQITSNYIYINRYNLPKIQKRKKHSHKGTFGHSLLIGGQNNMKGAIILAAFAAMKSGLGKLSVSLPNNYIKELNLRLPEVIVNNNLDFLKCKKYNAIGIGPGLGLNNVKILEKIITNRVNTPLVIDADAITIISNNKYLLKLCDNSIFTPHVKEFIKLVGNYNSDEEKLEKQVLFSKINNCILILKGAHTTISTPKGLIYFNSTGNTGLSKAGSGDVLTGLLTSMISQGYTNIEASILSVYIHGYASDLCLKEETEESMLPSNIIGKFGKVFKSLK